jgi:hypothetical protein
MNRWLDNDIACGLVFYFLQISVFSAPVLLGAILEATVLQPRGFWSTVRRISRILLFFACFMVVGQCVNILWGRFIAEHLYSSGDYCCADFIPFLPINATVINDFGPGSGHLYGVTLWQLQLIWLGFAIVTWAATILLYRSLSRRLFGGPRLPAPSNYPRS